MKQVQWLLGISTIVLSTWSTFAYAKMDTLIVAGGCFWCVEADFEKKAGVLDVVSGYTGGVVPNPTYEQVSDETTGHYEAVKITFDDAKISLRELVDYYWHTIDPTDAQGQFCDTGTPYRTALFYQSAQQKQVFTQSFNDLNATKPFNATIATKILPAKPFYLAEQSHQNYYKENPIRYKYYRWRCGRDERVKEIWGSVASQKK